MQLFSLIWNKPTWRRSWRTVPGAQLCWHQCLRFPRWSWSPSLLLRFHLPRSSQRPPQTLAPPRSGRPPMPPRPLARPPRRAAMQTNPAQMGSHVQTMRRTPRRARLTFIVLSVKSQSTPSLSWKHITAVLSRKELAFETDLYLIWTATIQPLHCSLHQVQSTNWCWRVTAFCLDAGGK